MFRENSYSKTIRDILETHNLPLVPCEVTNYFNTSELPGFLNNLPATLAHTSEQYEKFKPHFRNAFKYVAGS